MTQDSLKALAAEKAVESLSDGMVVGLGTGSTTRFAVDFIGQKLKNGRLKQIVGIPTSEATARQADALGIPLVSLIDVPRIDVAIDGADEVDPHLNLTKGWGGALVREKLVEMHADRLIIIVDDSKLVQTLGTRGPIPVEVTPFGWEIQARWLADVARCRVARREKNGEPYVTDNGNFILHCHFDDGLPNPTAFANELAGRTGVVGHGLFLEMATDVFVAAPDGIRQMRRA